MGNIQAHAIMPDLTNRASQRACQPKTFEELNEVLQELLLQKPLRSFLPLI